MWRQAASTPRCGVLRRRLCFGEIHGATKSRFFNEGLARNFSVRSCRSIKGNRSTASRPPGSPHSSGPPRPHFDGAVSAGTHSKSDGQEPLGTNFDCR
jgi:hypothetical protein